MLASIWATAPAFASQPGRWATAPHLFHLHVELIHDQDQGGPSALLLLEDAEKEQPLCCKSEAVFTAVRPRASSQTGSQSGMEMALVLPGVEKTAQGITPTSLPAIEDVPGAAMSPTDTEHPQGLPSLYQLP